MPTAESPQSDQRRCRAHAPDFMHGHVVGYVIADGPTAAWPLENAVHAYAKAHRLGTVEAVYRDAGTSSTRTGFQFCLRDLRTRRAHAVIVPSRTHLASDQSERASLLAAVRAAGGVVHIIDPHIEEDA